MKIIEANRAKEFASTFFNDPILKMAVNAVMDNVPEADAVPVVHGHWDEGVNNGYCCCSNCRDVYILEEWLVDGKWNYCPNCGAKMDGDSNA